MVLPKLFYTIYNIFLVRVVGFEPTISRIQTEHFTRLSYTLSEKKMATQGRQVGREEKSVSATVDVRIYL